MAKPEWGKKHRCSSCGKPFYDMQRDPIVCPGCGERHIPVKLLKSRKTTQAAVSEKTKPVDPDLEDDLEEIDFDLPGEDDISDEDDDEDDDISAVVVPKPKSNDD